MARERRREFVSGYIADLEGVNARARRQGGYYIDTFTPAPTAVCVGKPIRRERNGRDIARRREQLRHWHAKSGLTFRELARLLGINSWQTIQKYESGERTISRKEFDRIMETLRDAVKRRRRPTFAPPRRRPSSLSLAVRHQHARPPTAADDGADIPPA